MINQIALSGLDDYFKPLRSRCPGGIYFYRFNGYNDEIGAFLSKYYNAARQCGVIIEDRIPNPDNKNLSYYNEMLFVKSDKPSTLEAPKRPKEIEF